MKNGTRDMIMQSIQDFVYNDRFKDGLLHHLDRSNSALILYNGKIFGFDEFSAAYGPNLSAAIPKDSALCEYDTDYLLAAIFQFYLNGGDDTKLLTYDFTTSGEEISEHRPKNCVEFVECLRSILGQPSAFAVATFEGFLSNGFAEIACLTVRDGDAWLVFY